MVHDFISPKFFENIPEYKNRLADNKNFQFLVIHSKNFIFPFYLKNSKIQYDFSGLRSSTAGHDVRTVGTVDLSNVNIE